MFVARLLATLKSPPNHLGFLDDALVLDVDLYRAALLQLVRKLSAAGAVDAATAEWTINCIADGWVDEHLATLRDGLIELGAVDDQEHLDRLLMAATHQILGCGPGGHALPDLDTGLAPLAAADALLLHTVTQASQRADDELEPLGLRLVVRRYALELGLLARASLKDPTAGAIYPTPLADALLALPPSCVLTFLLALEMLQSQGVADRWRTPRAALLHMQAQAQFLVPTTGQARRSVDPGGLLPWRRIRRLHLLGVCEPVREPSELQPPARAAYPYRLSAAGHAAIGALLRQPASELLELAESLLHERAQAAVEPLLRRPVAPSAPKSVTVPPAPPPVERTAEVAPPPAELRPSEVTWRLEGPLATIPATVTTLPDAPPVSSPPLEALPSSGPLGEGRAQQEIDLGGLIRRAWEDLRVQRVHFALLGPAVRAVAERRALLQAWRELLRSAADAALVGAQSPPLVTVELDPGPDAVQILVHDSGPPIGPVEGPGSDPQLGGATAARDSDPGLPHLATGVRRGLWLAQRTLYEQGALLSLTAPQLGGTTVRVTLPRSPRSLRSAA
jgi:hypothetical protein